MNDWIRHGWKLIALVIIFGVVGRMDYEHEKQDEVHMKAYYEDIQKRFGREFAAVGDRND